MLLDISRRKFVSKSVRESKIKILLLESKNGSTYAVLWIAIATNTRFSWWRRLANHDTFLVGP